MAEMNKLAAAGASILLLCLPLQSNGADVPPIPVEIVPDDGIRAEMNGQWEDAVKIYMQSLAATPAQAHLWVRIADIRVKQGDLHAAQAALKEAIRLSPKNPIPYVKLSQVYAVLNEPQQALATINEAVGIEPDNVKYLQARGMLAGWNKDFHMASDSYTRILAKAPSDSEAMLGLARSSAQLGDKDKAGKMYLAYLGEKPQDKVAMLEYIDFQGVHGNMSSVRQYAAIYLDQFGEDLTYWLHMANIYGNAGDERAAAEAITQAVRLAQNDAHMLFLLAQAYPSVEDVGRAAAAINRAVELEPNNLEYLRARADIADWAGDYATTLDTCERILRIAPDDPGGLLGLARAQYWQGNTDAASRKYRAYLDKYPQLQLVWMEYIVDETERGNYTAAMDLLEQYRERFGENEAYLKQKARVLAWADRPTPSLSIVSALEPAIPTDYALNYTRTIALADAHRPSDALASLDEVVKLDPLNKDTAFLQRFIRTPLRSNVKFSFGHQSDSDTVSIRQKTLDGVYMISPETRLFGGVDEQQLGARAGSGFTKLNGDGRLNYRRAWGGVKHRVSPGVSLDGQVGAGDAGGRGKHIYEIGADLQPVDQLYMRLFRRRDLYAVSPRAADIGVMRRTNTLTLSWTPNLLYTVDGLFSYDDFSDGNARRKVEFSPHRAFVRSQRLNLDLGVSAYAYRFHMNPGYGYYAPGMYQRYSVNAYNYWKIGDDSGISVVASVGPWKDNTMRHYRTGADLTVEGAFGLYRDWMLQVSGSLSRYGEEGIGAYNSRAFNIGLTRRF